jgi:hypothetical protein
MRNMLAFLAAVALTVLGLGWYLEWYKFGTSPAPGGHLNVTFDVNAPKIGTDVRHAEENIQKKLLERNKQAGDAAGKALEPEKVKPTGPEGGASGR